MNFQLNNFFKIILTVGFKFGPLDLFFTVRFDYIRSQPLDSMYFKLTYLKKSNLNLDRWIYQRSVKKGRWIEKIAVGVLSGGRQPADSPLTAGPTLSGTDCKPSAWGV